MSANFHQTEFTFDGLVVVFSITLKVLAIRTIANSSSEPTDHHPVVSSLVSLRHQTQKDPHHRHRRQLLRLWRAQLRIVVVSWEQYHRLRRPSFLVCVEMSRKMEWVTLLAICQKIYRLIPIHSRDRTFLKGAVK
jgi:hypothetical protein